MISLIFILISFVLGICAIFLIFPPKSQEQIDQDDEQEAAHWAEYAEQVRQEAVRKAVKEKYPAGSIPHDFATRKDRVNDN